MNPKTEEILKEKINNTYNINEFKKAVWQYLLEHSSVTPEGYHKVMFISKGKKNFFGKIAGRRKGYKKTL